MATQALTVERPSSAIIGTVTETNDRIAQIEVRPSFREGEQLGLMLRTWGNGHWCTANGHPSYFTRRVDAEAAAERWINEGRA